MDSGVIIALVAFGIILYNSAKNAGEVTQYFDFNKLTNDAGDLKRLNNLYNVLMQQGLTEMQMQLLLSQMLFETGLLTNSANYNNIDNRNNWAGITHNGTYVTYASLQDFFNEYLQVLSKGTAPLEAKNVYDFNDRLYSNHYYTENKNVYENGLKNYFHQLYLSAQ
jgi:hypothetical protein